MAHLEAAADDVTPEEAVRVLDDATLQVFWRDWPQLSSWAGAVWRTVDRDLADGSQPSGELDTELGGSG